jgi:hypothetical protein
LLQDPGTSGHRIVPIIPDEARTRHGRLLPPPPRSTTPQRAAVTPPWTANSCSPGEARRARSCMWASSEGREASRRSPQRGTSYCAW